MKTSLLYAIAAGKLVASHATFQSFVIGGKDQGQHFAVRKPSNGNNPIYDPNSSAIICNGGTATNDFVEVAAGSDLTMQWHHNDGASTQGDADEPIASSHKGPVMVYVAPAESDGKGAVWQKIFEEGLGSDGKWGVDKFIANKGAITVKVPDLAPGNYLFRSEIIALHEAQTAGKAQFYNGCGQVKVTGSGSVTLPAGTDLTKAYSTTEPGVQVNIYNGIKDYKIPGPALFSGASSGSSPAAPANPPASSGAPAKPTISAPPSAPSASPSPVAPAPTTFVTSTKPTPTGTGSSTGAVAKYERCGGKGYNGATACSDGFTCKFQNDYYSQCVPAAY